MMPVLSLHHVTATVDDPQADLDFCLEGLGLRLVKKTVNFDNHYVYHFYYGDDRGTPGTLWTTFPYKGRGVKAGAYGAGQVTVTSFSVPAGSLAFWKSHLRALGIDVADIEPRFREDAVRFSDRSGLVFELIATGRDGRAPWTRGGVDPDAAIRGLHSVKILVRDPTKTVHLMTTLLGFEVIDDADGRIRLAAGGDEPGHAIDVCHDPNADIAVNGLGTVHHVAMAVTGEDEQLRLRAELIQYGCRVTEVRDRCYFKSIYFREPGNVLFEIATVPPGFLIDEDLGTLGRDLQLPPWEEANRGDIEAGLLQIATTSPQRRRG
jgi:glyoxalase family protein